MPVTAEVTRAESRSDDAPLVSITNATRRADLPLPRRHLERFYAVVVVIHAAAPQADVHGRVCPVFAPDGLGGMADAAAVSVESLGIDRMNNATFPTAMARRLMRRGDDGQRDSGGHDHRIGPLESLAEASPVVLPQRLASLPGGRRLDLLVIHAAYSEFGADHHRPAR
jgi:hypothetical protein